jgi:hypothetical protein
MTNEFQTRLDELRQRITRACGRAHRPSDSVRLLAVSKTFDARHVIRAILGRQIEFGENYVQEALPKIQTLAAMKLRPVWHYIGPLQSNKTRAIAEHFDWAQTIDRLKVAERLSTQRPENLGPLNVCVQVNISAEDSKSGCTPAEAVGLCIAIARLPGLRLRGLMSIPAPAEEPQRSRPGFKAMNDLFQMIRHGGDVDPMTFDTLSMGMSDDFEVAIEEGATLVRIGSALFGARPKNSQPSAVELPASAPDTESGSQDQ